MSTTSTGRRPLRGAAAVPVRRRVTGSTGAAVPGAAGPAASTKIIFRVLGLLHFFDGRGGLFAPGAWHQSRRTSSIFLAVQGLQLEKLYKGSAFSSSAPPGDHLCSYSGTPHQAEGAGLQLLHTAAGAHEHLQAAGELSDTTSQEPISISSARSAAVAAVPGREELEGPSAAPGEVLDQDATAGVNISLSLKQRTLPILNLNGDTISHVSLPIESRDDFRKEFFENYLLVAEGARTTRDTAGYAGAGGTSGTTAKANVGHLQRKEVLLQPSEFQKGFPGTYNAKIVFGTAPNFFPDLWNIDFCSSVSRSSGNCIPSRVGPAAPGAADSSSSSTREQEMKIMCDPHDHLGQNDETTQLDLFNRQLCLNEVGLGLAHHLPGPSSIHGRGTAAVTNFHQHAVLIRSQLPSLADPWTFYRGTDLLDKIEEYVFSDPGDDYLYQINGCRRERTVPGGGIRCENFVIEEDPSDQEFRTHVFTVLNNIWVALQEEARTNEALAFVLLGKKLQMQSKSAAHNREGSSTAEQGSSSSSSGNYKAREDVLEDPAAPYQDAGVFLPRSGRFLPREDLLLADLLAEREFEFVPSRLAFDVDNDTVRIKRASGSGLERDPHREPSALQEGRRLHRSGNYVISVTSEQSLKYTVPENSDLDLSHVPTCAMFYGAPPRKQAKPVFRFDLEFAPRIATVDKARPSFDGWNSSSSSSGASGSETSDESFAADGAEVDHDRRWEEVEPVDFYREFGIPLPHERRGFSVRKQANDVVGVGATAGGATGDVDEDEHMLGPPLALPNQAHDGEDDNVEMTPAQDEPEQAQAHRDEPPSFPPPPPTDADMENAKRHYPLAKVFLTICYPLKKQIPGHSLICMDVEVTYPEGVDDQQVSTADGGGSPGSPTTYKVAVGGYRYLLKNRN
ncbi:unnamed protein product [Amoebophrya sp. A120]|nr:unnamed protein product [Amoebophrya sp. A120]|eukprot:GSA120T00013535001.1